MQVLLLNATYEPLSIVSVRRAAVLVLQHKAEIVEATEAWLRAQSMALPMPAVIRLVYYVRVPRYLPWPLSRRTVLARDNYTCQYCGAQPGKTRLTLDHVIPRVRGGETTWENLVTACVSCNRRKGARTPEEAGMRLLRRPTRPRYLALALLNDFSSQPAWHKYLWDWTEESVSR